MILTDVMQATILESGYFNLLLSTITNALTHRTSFFGRVILNSVFNNRGCTCVLYSEEELMCIQTTS
jgi:hypothetical protein